MMDMKILSVEQTFFLRRAEGGLEQLLRAEIELPCACAIRLVLDGRTVLTGEAAQGRQTLSFYRAEPAGESEAMLALYAGEAVTEFPFHSKRPRHLSVHVVQLSHHDLGYTDIPSRVFGDHDRSIAGLLDIADAYEDRTGDERFRVVLEQSWSLDHFMKTASKEDRERLMARITSGDFELTALYGNQITEIMGHEELYRLMDPSMRIARAAGVPLISAEHNDETGVAWGLCRALCDAGVKIFCPGMSLYYSWGGKDLPSFWEERAVFDAEGPGAFWWEAPDGKRLLFWCNNSGCGGDNSGSLKSLEDKMHWLAGKDWPYSVLRWPVGGANRDNSPYTGQWTDSIREWNAKWAFPRAISSTNARFYDEFIARLDRELPVHRGDLPGQDYPPGSMSLPEATIAARGAQRLLEKAETLASLAEITLGAPDQTNCVREAYDNLLLSDEHAYGYQFPAGYAMRAGQVEKRVFGARAEAFADEIAQKALATLADSAEDNGHAFRLLVYNPGARGDLAVETPMREFDNTGSEIVPDKTGALRGYLLCNRMHANPELDLVNGRFKLIDIASGEEVPYQIDAIEPDSPEPFAPERHGLSQGTRRYGFFEDPLGLRKTLRFVAKDMPDYGYRTYALVPVDDAKAFAAPAEKSIENEYYRLRWEENGIVSLMDLTDGVELLDAACPHRLGEVLIRRGNDVQARPMRITAINAERGAIADTLTVHARAEGVPTITITFRLWKGLRRLDIAARILRDGTPMNNAHMAFPFFGKGFRYDAPLAALTPVRDFLPGAQSDALAVRDWIRIGGSEIRLEALDSPIVSLGGLHPGYVSPAHRCLMPEQGREPLTAAEYEKNGWVYSMLFSNNYGTNWAVSGSGELLFRYVIGEDCATGMTIFTDRSNQSRPASDSLMRIENAQLLTLKRAENGHSYILRLWNREEQARTARVCLDGHEITAVLPVDALERPLAGDKGGMRLRGDEVRALSITL